MITVIIAGGSGTRLWPLSTPKYPKHLLKLISDDTLLQSAYDRARSLGETIYVVTEASHSSHVKEQLPQLADDAFIIEPGRRGTAHCIVMALDYIARRHSHDEPIAFIHSDHHVRDKEGFARSFALAARTSEEKGSISLIGVEPTYPATGFGYIEKGEVLDADRGVYNVKSFKEKPEYDLAQEYVESGNYLWNCGYFVGSLAVFLNKMESNAPELKKSYEALSSIDNFGSEDYKARYLGLDNQVIDVALIEKTQDLIVVSAGFDWMDIGSFKDLHNNVHNDSQGNHFRGENINAMDVESVYVRNEESKPIAVIGLDNVIVVNTPDGLLVARRSSSHRVGEIAKKIQG